MNYGFSEISYPSSDGIHTIHAEIYTPRSGQYKAVVQISHGMIDYVGRYEALADFLTGEGYVVAGNDHLGHGKSVSTPDEYGFFARKNGTEYAVDDVRKMNEQLRQAYPELPIILLGHSMGSFIARLYAVKYPKTIDAIIIHGTAGPNKALPVGKALAAMLSVFLGAKHRSRAVAAMAFAGYNSKFPKSEGKNAWLTRELSLVADKDADPRSGFIFTLSGYRDLFRFLGGCNSKSWYKNYPKELPTLILSGDADPVGAYGKGPTHVYKHLMEAGCTELQMKLYEGARHELFNETNRDEVFRDIAEWLRAFSK